MLVSRRVSAWRKQCARRAAAEKNGMAAWRKALPGLMAGRQWRASALHKHPSIIHIWAAENIASPSGAGDALGLAA
jgi:hypothetical protein